MTDASLAESIAYELRRDILRGILPAGATIKERDNADRQGVSRTPMREAIRILANEGLVLLRPSRSPIVADPSLRDISDQLRVLRALELLSGELACTEAHDSEIARIGEMKERVEAIYDKADPLDVFELDMEFHAAIVRASHNQALIETHSAYLARLWRVRYLSARRRNARRRVLRQHSAIYDALVARNSSGIKTQINGHLIAIEENIATHFREEGNMSASATQEADKKP